MDDDKIKALFGGDVPESDKEVKTYLIMVDGYVLPALVSDEPLMEDDEKIYIGNDNMEYYINKDKLDFITVMKGDKTNDGSLGPVRHTDQTQH